MKLARRSFDVVVVGAQPGRPGDRPLPGGGGFFDGAPPTPPPASGIPPRNEPRSSRKSRDEAIEQVDRRLRPFTRRFARGVARRGRERESELLASPFQLLDCLLEVPVPLLELGDPLAG